MNCEICNAFIDAETSEWYGDSKCMKCGAKYQYDEKPILVLDDDMKRAVREILRGKK